MSISDGELTSMALCWRLERMDGAGIGLTSHDQTIAKDGVQFAPAPGMLPAAVKRSIGLESASAEVTGALSSAALEDEDLALGRWDGATVGLTAIDWSDTNTGLIALMGGEIGSVSIDGDGFRADLRGAAARLDDPVCPATSAECRAHFGDKSCRVDLAGRSIRAHVVQSSGGTLTLDQTVDARFVLGRLRFINGLNCGLSTVILSAAGSDVQMRDQPRAEVQVGCVVELREGCDKRFATCVSWFGNAVNFRGEPHLPGNDLLTRYPGV